MGGFGLGGYGLGGYGDSNGLTSDQFRADFPEFANTTTYPDSQIDNWLSFAATLLTSPRWATLLTLGQELIAAHYLFIAMRDQATAAAGGTPGQVVGLKTGQTVGSVSATYDFTALLIPDAGFWNQSSYGQRFFQLARLMGAGGIQLPGCCC